MNSLFFSLFDQNPTFLILFALGIAFFVIPKFIRTIKETVSEYRGMLGAKADTETISEKDLNARIVILNQAIDRFENEKVVQEIDDLRGLLGSNPEKILTIQRLTFEIESIKNELESIKSNNKWLIGIIFTLVFGLLATIATMIGSTIGIKGA